VRSTRPTFGRCPAVPAKVPDPFLNHAENADSRQPGNHMLPILAIPNRTNKSPIRCRFAQGSTGNCLVSLLLLSMFGSSVLADATVELTLVTEDRAPVTAQHEWARDLSRAGITDVRIRAQRAHERLGVEVRGTPSAPIYSVTGQITAANEIRFPGARFRSGDAAGVARWLDDLAQRGPAEQRPKMTAFGLDVNQFEQVHDDLTKTVGFATRQKSRAQVVRKMAERLSFPLKIDQRQLRAMENDKVAEELSGFSCGTALACLVRPMGMCLVPRPSAGGAIEYTIVAEKEGVKPWPIGWESKKSKRETLPKLLEFLNANLEGVPLAKVLESLGEALDVPILMDHGAMARHEIDPAKVIINLPQSRTTYASLLKRVLFQARLKSQLRVDEAGSPLFWVTTLKRD
jgi:hypothetical protein